MIVGEDCLGAIEVAILDFLRTLEEEIDDLQQYVSKVLDLPEVVMDDSQWQWENAAVFVWSLGRKVLMEWVVKEVRLKSKFDHDPERFSNGGPSPLVPVEDGLCCGSQRQSLVCSWTVVGNEGMGAGLCTEKEGD